MKVEDLIIGQSYLVDLAGERKEYVPCVYNGPRLDIYYIFISPSGSEWYTSIITVMDTREMPMDKIKRLFREG